MDPYDFGPVIPDGCCDEEVTTAEELSPVRLNYTIIAYGEEPLCECKYPKFTVNLHMDGSWSFTFTNGVPLTNDQITFYCREIAGAQSLLETQERYRRNGRNIGVWDPNKNFGFAGNGAVADDGTLYFPAGASGPGNFGSCSVQTPINNI